jgi:glycosyltransferase involved in cell wall biosynthesis
MPHAALVHDNFGGPTGMGLVTLRQASWLLDAGWTLTLVGENIDAELAARCRVVRVPAPRKLPSLFEHLGWCARVALATRRLEADVVHVHSPLLARRADLLTSHFMAQPAHARGVRELTTGPEGRLRQAQGEASRRIDDAAYRHVGPRPFVSFVSEFLRDEYRRHYGSPRGGWILAPPAPAWNPPSAEERAAARAEFGVRCKSIVAGYVGGSDPRKGWFHLEPLTAEPDIELLAGGPGSEKLRFGGRPGFGVVDVERFYAACDVVVAPAAFDSAPVALLQAVARGVPAVTTAFSGWAKAIDRTGAGVVWNAESALADAVRAAVRGELECRQRFTEEFSERNQRNLLLEAFATILATRAA